MMWIFFKIYLFQMDVDVTEQFLKTNHNFNHLMCI